MPLFDASGKVLDIAAARDKGTFDIKAEQRFTMPSVYDVFMADDTDGGFKQIIPQMGTKEQALDAMKMLRNNPDFLGRKLFVVEVKRIPIVSNFPPNAMRLMQLGQKIAPTEIIGATPPMGLEEPSNASD